MDRELGIEDIGKRVKILRHENETLIDKTGLVTRYPGSPHDQLGPFDMSKSKHTCGVVLDGQEHSELTYVDDIEFLEKQ